jgi:hypothetical protein
MHASRYNICLNTYQTLCINKVKATYNLERREYKLRSYALYLRLQLEKTKKGQKYLMENIG